VVGPPKASQKDGLEIFVLKEITATVWRIDLLRGLTGDLGQSAWVGKAKGRRTQREWKPSSRERHETSSKKQDFADGKTSTGRGLLGIVQWVEECGD
jgi:hypothetical protein